MPASDSSTPLPDASKPPYRRLSRTLSDTDAHRKLIEDASRSEKRVSLPFRFAPVPTRIVPITPPMLSLPFALDESDPMAVENTRRAGISRKRRRSLYGSDASVADSQEGPELRRPRRGKERAHLSTLLEGSGSDNGSSSEDSRKSRSRSITPLGTPRLDPPGPGPADPTSSPSFPLRDATFTPASALNPPSDRVPRAHSSASTRRPLSRLSLALHAPVPRRPSSSIRALSDAPSDFIEPPPPVFPTPPTPARNITPGVLPVALPILEESADRQYSFRDEDGAGLYNSTRRDLDLHHNSVAASLTSLMSTQDKLWEALQVNLDMSRAVLRNVIGQSEFFAPDGNMIKGMLQIQNNVSSCVQEAHESLATYIGQVHSAQLGALDEMQVDEPAHRHSAPPDVPQHPPAVTPVAAAPVDSDRILSAVLDLGRSINMKIDQRAAEVDRRMTALQSSLTSLSGRVSALPAQTHPPSRPPTPGPWTAVVVIFLSKG